MQTNLAKLENNIVSLEFTAEPTEVKEALDQAFKKVVKKVSIPGFRKGKVPRRVLETHYGKEVLYEDAIQILVTKGYFQALDEHQLEPIDEPKLEIVQGFEDDQPFKFKAEVEVLPEVEVGEYKGLKVEKTVPSITEEDVEKELKALQERHAELVEAKKERVETGDFAVIDFDGYIEGKPFPGGAAQGITVEIGGNNFIPGFEEGLIGMTPGSEKEIKAIFPEDYHNTELAGKEGIFKTKLHEIKEKELPELNDDFAKSLGRGESMDDLKQDLRRHMQEVAEEESKKAFERAVVEKVVQESKVEIPEKLIERELDHLIHEFEHDLSYRGLKLEQYMASSNQTMDDFRQSLRPEAEKRVKIDLVLSSISKMEGISGTDDEVNERIEKTLLYYPEDQRDSIRQRMKNPNVTEGIKSSLLREKTVKHLVELADVVEKKISEDEEVAPEQEKPQNREEKRDE